MSLRSQNQNSTLDTRPGGNSSHGIPSTVTLHTKRALRRRENFTVPFEITPIDTEKNPLKCFHTHHSCCHKSIAKLPQKDYSAKCGTKRYPGKKEFDEQ
ncbi:hypothetical protein CEXT_165481 [Caerostris extrusa]|uniref:Uncharacterized protein n=1 Tax=Caerostris extrusa TaxID=172846 RepID=A0AAV4VE68_CAEEX|nr:hypothetical protein CEXT_165481 [Caerostris extrusa]